MRKAMNNSTMEGSKRREVEKRIRSEERIDNRELKKKVTV